MCGVCVCALCQLISFPLSQPRRDVLIAEVVWFFRVQEVPESLYLLLQEDRKAGQLLVSWVICNLIHYKPLVSLIDLCTDQAHKSYFDPRVTQRELFIAHNVDTHSTSLFRYTTHTHTDTHTCCTCAPQKIQAHHTDKHTHS